MEAMMRPPWLQADYALSFLRASAHAVQGMIHERDTRRTRYRGCTEALNMKSTAAALMSVFAASAVPACTNTQATNNQPIGPGQTFRIRWWRIRSSLNTAGLRLTS